jgi:hypothetical protein
MPCTQTGSLEGDHILALQEQIKENKHVAAMLCGVMTVLEKHPEMAERVLSEFDEKEAGFRVVQLKDWWEEHKRRDRARRQREAAAARRQREIEEAKAALTPKQRRLLGL